MKHPIKIYSEKTGVSITELAKKLKTSQSYVSQIIMGIRRPRPEFAIEIERATDGFVRKEDLVFWPKRQR